MNAVSRRARAAPEREVSAQHDRTQRKRPSLWQSRSSRKVDIYLEALARWFANVG